MDFFQFNASRFSESTSLCESTRVARLFATLAVHQWRGTTWYAYFTYFTPIEMQFAPFQNRMHFLYYSLSLFIVYTFIHAVHTVGLEPHHCSFSTFIGPDLQPFAHSSIWSDFMPPSSHQWQQASECEKQRWLINLANFVHRPNLPKGEFRQVGM